MELCFWIKKKGKTDENCNEVSQLFSISFFTKEKQAFFQEHQVTKINLNLLEFPEDLESFPGGISNPLVSKDLGLGAPGTLQRKDAGAPGARPHV